MPGPGEPNYFLKSTRLNSPPVLALVKLTESEALCQRMADRNVIRDFHIWVLIRIMDVYSFMRCCLNADGGKISVSEINALYRSPQLIKKKKGSLYHSLHIFFENNGRGNYFQEQVFWDCLSRFYISQGDSSQVFNYENEITKKFAPLSKVALEETLWDPGDRRIHPERLKEYIAKYTWAFPPNTAELLEEMLASPEIRAEFEKESGKKITELDPIEKTA